MIPAAYTTWGCVRGMGPIRSDRAAAERDLDEDRAACERQRGYSDRSLCLIDEDGYLYEDDGDGDLILVWPSHGRSTGAVRVELDDLAQVVRS